MPAEETLSYYIRAYNLASPVFKDFAATVEATNRQVQASMTAMNRAMLEQSRVMAEVTAGHGRAGSAASAHQGSMRAAADSMAAQSAGMRSASTDMRRYESQLLATDAAQAKVATSATRGATEVKNVGGAASDAATEIEKHKNAIEQLGYGLSGFAGQLGPLGRSLDTASKHAQLFRTQGIDYLAAGLVGGAAAFGAYGIHAVNTFNDIQKALEAQTGAGQKTTAQLVKDVQQVATVAPESYQTIAQAVGTQYKLLHENTAEIKRNADQFLAFANAAGMQVTPAITDVNQVMKLFHGSAGSVNNVMDKFINLSQHTQQPLSEYLALVSRLGPSFKAMGLNLNDVIGLFDAFSKAGVSSKTMAQGLATVLSKAATEMKANTKLIADAPDKLHSYNMAVENAQLAITRLSQTHITATTTQADLNAKMLIAEQRLHDAQQRYTQEATAVNQAKAAHQSLTGVVAQELSSITDASSRQKALNLAVQEFGGHLGPQMADALYHNKAALLGMEKSLGSSKGATEKLAEAQRTSLHAQLILLEHDFTNVAASVGQVLLPPLDFLIKGLGDVAKFAAGIPKPILDALVLGGGALGAGLLTMRHTPLGGIVSQAAGVEQPWLKALLTGKSTTGQAIAGVGEGGQLYGASGRMTFVGSEANPLATMLVGSALPGGSPTGPLSSSERGAAAMSAEEAAAMEARGQGALFGPGIGARAMPGEQLSLGTISPAVATATETTAVEASALSGIKGMFGSLMHGGMIAGLGAMGSQMVGSMVGGQTGRTISNVGTGASIGAGLGSFLGPEGTIAGGVLGGLVAGVTQFIGNDATKYGDQLATKLAAGLPTAIPHAMVQGIANAANAARTDSNLSNLTGGKGAPLPYAVGRTGLPDTAAGRKQAAADVAAQQALVAKQYAEEGTRAGNAFATSFGQVKYKSEPALFTDFMAMADKLDPRARDAAAKVAIQYAQGLQASGDLPKHAVQNLIFGIESQFPQLASFLKTQGLATGRQVADTMNMTGAVSNLQATVDKMKTTFGVVPADFGGDMTVTGQNLATKLTEAMTTLQADMTQGTSQMRAAAKTQYEGLVADSTSYLGDLVATTSSHTGAVTKAVATNTAQAAQIGTANFQALAGNMATYIGAGAEATAKGLNSITAEVNQQLKLFGEKGLSASQVQAATPAQLAAVVSGQVSSGGLASTHATGGRVPGAVSGDSWTLVDPAGRARGRVGGAELLISNRHTEADMSRATIAMYGKTAGEMVAGERLPHSAAMRISSPPRYATGGSATGGDVYPFGPGAVQARLDQGDDMTGVFTIGAIGAGKVIGDQLWPGWPGTGGVVYTLTSGPRSGMNVYSMEHLQTLVHTGQTLVPGQAIANVLAGYPWSESGWANAAGTGPLTPYNGAPDGTVMPGARDFAAFVAGLQHGKIVGGAGGLFGGGLGWRDIKVPKIPGASSSAMAAVEQGALTDVVRAANAYGQSKAGLGGLGGFTGGGNAQANEALGRRMMLAAGWSADQWPSLLALWMQESGWSSYAVNQSSGAYGIPQSLGHGHPYALGDAPAQIAWGLNYIKGRYGSPAAAEAHERAFNWYGQGGRIAHAGAFGQGGAFTAHGPTTALFGEHGDETVVAIPTSDIRIAASQAAAAAASSSVNFSTDVSTTAPGVPGWVQPTQVGTPSPAKATKTPAAQKLHTGLNPFTNKIETLTEAQWQQLKLVYEQEKKAAEAAKKKLDAYLAQQVTDRLVVDGINVGDIPGSRKSLIGAGLPGGGKIGLGTSEVTSATEAGFKKILSALGAQLKLDNSAQILGSAGGGRGGGILGALEHAMGKLDDHLVDRFDKLRSLAEKRQDQAEKLHKEALKKHGDQRADMIAKAHADHVESMHASAAAANESGKIMASRSAQLVAAAVTAAMSATTAQFTAQQSQFSHEQTIAQLLESAPAGSTAKSLGLSPLMLKASGLTPKIVRKLTGQDSGPAGFAQQIQFITRTEIPKYEQDAKQYQHEYEAALKAHNQKQANALLTQLDAVTQATLQAYSAIQTAQINQIDAIVTKYTTKATNLQSASDMLSTIQNFAPGTNLASMGLTPKVLSSLGLGPAELKKLGIHGGLASLEGGSLSYIQNLEQQQGGKLTAAQLTSAQQGVAAQNAILGAERAQDMKALGALQEKLPHLKGKAEAEAEAQMKALAGSILGLTNTMNSNNDQIHQLTQAMSANTTATMNATGQMTGTVGFTYGGQNYVAGGTSTSDDPANINMGN